MTLRALQDLFQRHRDRATGHWKLSSEGGRTIFLEMGDVVFATSGRPEDRLTSLLVERGRLTQVQLDYAMANLKPGLSIGRNLIDMGYITQRDLLDVARLQVERVVLGALGVADESAQFESRELDANTVRLPMDTPQLLLSGILDLRDREGILELLGPLNQVVVLEGRKHLALSLPPDLASLPARFDGTRTLLELGREVSVEVLRLGAFALFLREMGWARLHELPPLDPSALDLALATEPLAPRGPLPESSEAELPNLFAAIRDAERPTTNLEHLSRSLDEALDTAPMDLPLPPLVVAPPDEPLPEPILAEGEVSMPTPALELPEFVEPELEPEVDDEPAVTLQASTLGLEPEPFEAGSATLPAPAASRPVRWWLWLVLAGLGVGAVFGWGVLRGHGGNDLPPVPAAVPQVTPTLQPKPAEPVPAPTPAETSPAPVTSPKPESTRGTKPKTSLEAIRAGALDEAVTLGEALAKGSSSRWCIRLMVATQVETVQKAPERFDAASPDLFLLPFRFRDGRSSYQVLLGTYPDRAAAEAALSRLPSAFREGGNRPLIFQVRDVPRRQ